MSTMISLQSILWSALAAAAGIGLPVLVFLVWKFKFCRGAKLFPAVVGAVTFVVFAQVLEGVPKAIFFGGGTGVSQYVLTHAWAYTLIGCLLAGVFEEVGRYLAFRFLLKRYTNRRDAVTYGIGHGGIEAILVLGLTAINNIAIAQLVNSGSIETITNGLTGVQLDQVQAQIAAVASFGAANLLLGLAERAIAMTLHISLSWLYSGLSGSARPGIWDWRWRCMRCSMFPPLYSSAACCTVPGWWKHCCWCSAWAARLTPKSSIVHCKNRNSRRYQIRRKADLW